MRMRRGNFLNEGHGAKQRWYEFVSAPFMAGIDSSAAIEIIGKRMQSNLGLPLFGPKEGNGEVYGFAGIYGQLSDGAVLFALCLYDFECLDRNCTKGHNNVLPCLYPATCDTAISITDSLTALKLAPDAIKAAAGAHTHLYHISHKVAPQLDDAGEKKMMDGITEHNDFKLTGDFAKDSALLRRLGIQDGHPWLMPEVDPAPLAVL